MLCFFNLLILSPYFYKNFVVIWVTRIYTNKLRYNCQTL